MKSTTPAPQPSVVKAPPPDRTVLDGLPFDPGDRALPRGLRLFGTQLERVRKVLATPVPPAALRGEVLYKSDLRSPLFMLEGLARASVSTGNDKDLFRDVLKDVKILEDVSGEVDFWSVLSTKGAAWELPPEFLRYAQDHHRAATGRLVGWLEARAWVDHRYLPDEGTVSLRVHRIGRSLQELSWPSPAKERKRLGAFLLATVRSTERAAHKLDLTNVEHGIHELRRKLRWISIYAASQGGAIQLNRAAKAPRNWSAYLSDAVVNNPFNQLPEGDGSIKPVVIPAPLFFALSWLIGELGAIKDRAQWTEAVTHGLHSVGVKARRPLGDVALGATEAGKLTAAIAQKTLFEDKLLTRLAEAIEAASK